jgi:hypothetical protein
MEGVSDTAPRCSIRRHFAGFNGVTTREPHPQQHMWLAVLKRLEI